MSEARKQRNLQGAKELINQLFSDMVPQGRTKNSYLYYDPPKDWKGTVYIFAYTPWRTKHDGVEGFWTLKYRVYKDGHWKLVKKIRFGRRKIADKRAKKWWDAYYKTEAS